MKIRKGTFETNSSSTHSIAISKNKVSIPVGCSINFHIGEYGWEESKYNFPDYMYTSLLCNDDEEELKKCVRIWPHKMNGEGHFIALLHKKDRGEELAKKVKPRKEKALPPLLEEFMKDCSYPVNGADIEIQEDRVYLMPEGIKGIKGLRFLRSGLLLGTLTKDRFEPSQAFAMVLKKEQYKATIDLSSLDHRVIRYLKGETIDVDDLPLKRQKGWQLVCVDGYPLGWGKLVNGSLRNKYLPGWRWQS